MQISMYLFARAINAKDTDEYDAEIVSWWGGNQIREWLINNTGYNKNNHGAKHPVTKLDLVRLLTDCKEVLKDSGHAEEILPIGHNPLYMDYIEYGSVEYFQTTIDTIKAIEQALNDIDWDREQAYYYEWW